MKGMDFSQFSRKFGPEEHSAHGCKETGYPISSFIFFVEELWKPKNDKQIKMWSKDHVSHQSSSVHFRSINTANDDWRDDTGRGT